MVNVTEIRGKTIANRQTQNERDAARMEQEIDDAIHYAADRGESEIHYTADRTISSAVITQIVDKYRDAGLVVTHQDFSLALSIEW